MPDGGQAQKALGLRVRLGYRTADEFASKFAVNVARGGLFLPSRDPKPPGTAIRFELLLAGGERVLAGAGVVQRVVAPAAGQPGTPGMVVQFTALDAHSRAMVDLLAAQRERIAAARQQAHAAPPPQPRPAPAPRRAPAAPPPDPPPPVVVRPAPAPEPSIDVDLGDDEPEPPPGPPPTLTPTPAPLPPARPGPAQADLSAPHAVQQLAAGPLNVDLGLPAEPTPVKTPSRAIIGIDLGTTNSCAAIVKDGRPYVIPSREGHNTVPSIVAINARRKLMVGHLARAQQLSNPKDTIYGAKRLVGRRFDSKQVQHIREAFAYDVVEGDDGLAAIEIAGQRVTLEQVSALILREVKEVAQNHLGEEVNRAVITVPAYYNERQREAVRRAGALAGFHVERIVNEPTAAALAYAYGRRLRQRVLVYDLGGGTFDASILELQDNVYEVISTGGDTFLGGVDFDTRIVGRLLETYQQQVGQRFDGDAVALSRLVDAAERAKRELSERQESRIQLPFLAMTDQGPVALDTTLGRDEVVELVRPLVERTLEVCRDVLAAKNLKPSEIDEVILVGGQSRMPLVQEQVKELFGKSPSRAVHPDEAVAIGAALLAHSLNTAEGLVLIDVLPMSIGVALPDGRVRKVFERNTPLPARKQYALATTRDGQREFELTVVQGEGATEDDCEYLGTVRLDHLPSGPRGMVKIAVGFELGAECLLTVTARELATNRVVESTFAPRARPARSAEERKAAKGLETSSHAIGPAQATAPPQAGKVPRRGLVRLLRRLMGRRVEA